MNARKLCKRISRDCQVIKWIFKCVDIGVSDTSPSCPSFKSLWDGRVGFF